MEYSNYLKRRGPNIRPLARFLTFRKFRRYREFLDARCRHRPANRLRMEFYPQPNDSIRLQATAALVDFAGFRIAYGDGIFVRRRGLCQLV